MKKAEALRQYRNTVEEIKEAGLFKGEAPLYRHKGLMSSWKTEENSSTCAQTIIWDWPTPGN